MLLRLITLVMGAAAVAACAEPVVEMELEMPANAATFDASCVSAITVRVAGANYAQDINDYTYSCMEITPQERLSGIHDAIRGKFTLEIPASGMSGIELYGWSGPQACDPFATPDLIFHSASPYIGQDQLDLRIETTMDCAKQQIKVRPVELFTLVGGATPSAANCATAAMPDADGWAGLGQLMERDFASGVDYWGGVRGTNLSGGVAAFSAGTTGLSKSCLAYDAESTNGYAASCVMAGGKVCAGADEIDAPYVGSDIGGELATFDELLMSRWDSMVFVSVWDNGNPKKPIAGAKVEIAATDGQVVYIDPPTAGSNRLLKRDNSATGTSGLAMVYTNKLSKVKVTANGATREVTVAAPDWGPGGALVVMP